MHMQPSQDESSRVVQSQKGDHDAFECLVRDNQRLIHGLCYRMTGSLEDAEDLAQQTFIHAYQNLDTFRGEARLSSWLYRIALNQCLNWRKRIARRDQLAREWTEQNAVTVDSPPAFAQQIQEALMK